MLKIAFRVDGGTMIGSGHVMRCLALAEALHECGAQVRFVIREHAGHLADLLEAHGFATSRLPPPAEMKGPQYLDKPEYADWLGVPWQTDADQTIHALEQEAPWDWLVVDHYALDTDWELALRAISRRIMVIDDLENRPHDCDLLLDQNPGLEADIGTRYANYVPQNCTRLLGPRYTLLRPAFRAWRKYARTRVRNLTTASALIMFGSSQGLQLASNALADTCHCNHFQSIRVVISHLDARDTSAIESIRSVPDVDIFVSPPNLAEIMANSDVAFGAIGVTAWERCCLSLPSVCVATAPNQKTAAVALSRLGAIKLLNSQSDSGDFTHAIEEWFARPDAYREAVSAAAAVTDGLGIPRVTEILYAH